MYQFVLRQTLRVRCGLQILVGHIQMTVPQVIPNGELMLAHLRQHRSHGVTEVCQPTPVIPILANAGCILRCNTTPSCSGFCPFFRTEGKTKSVGAA